MKSELFRVSCEKLCAESAIRSAVLFGSSARSKPDSIVGDEVFSDLDFHIICKSSALQTLLNIGRRIDSSGLCSTSIRGASGSVKKITIVFNSGQLDLVAVPELKVRMAEWGLRLGLSGRIVALTVALNEMATCLHSGYRFVKGERQWRSFYDKVNKLPGVRMSDIDIVIMAEGTVCDILWILQKTAAGELIAAKHVLHTRVVDSNLRLIREGRIRRGESVSSFGLGRKLEMLGSDWEIRCVAIGPSETTAELQKAVRVALVGLLTLMQSLVPTWRMAEKMVCLLERFGLLVPTPVPRIVQQ